MGYIGQGPGLGQELAFRFVGVAGQGVIAGPDAHGLPLVYTPGAVDVYRNGRRLTIPEDVVAVDGSQIVPRGWAIQAGDEIIVVVKAPFSPANTYTRAEADAAFHQRRNRVVDPGCRVSQENGTVARAVATAGAFVYASDGVAVQALGGAANCVSAQRVASVTPGGSGTRVRLTVTKALAAPAAGDLLRICLPVEGIEVADLRWGAAGARMALIRFGFRAPAAGTFPIAITNRAGGATRSWLGAGAAGGLVTIQPGEVGTDVVRWALVPGDAVGAWAADIALGLVISLTLCAGATWQGQPGWQDGEFYGLAGGANLLASVGQTLDVFDLGLHDVSDISNPAPPRFALKAFSDDLRDAQRYYRKIVLGALVDNGGQSGYGCRFNFSLSPSMRINPNGSFASAGSGDSNVATVGIGYTTPHSFTVNATYGGSAGQLVIGDGSTVTLNARML